MSVTQYDLDIPQGEAYVLVIDIVNGPDDLTGYEGWMQIRPTKQAEEVLADFSTSEITVNPNTDQVVLTIPDTDTVDFTWDNGVYDLVIRIPGQPLTSRRVIEGRVIIDHSVTR